MVTYIIRRLLLGPVLLFGVTLLIFGMLQFISPVERTALYVRDIPKNDKQIEGLIRRYGFDQPLYIQYWRWLVGTKDPVTGGIGRHSEHGGTARVHGRRRRQSRGLRRDDREAAVALADRVAVERAADVRDRRQAAHRRRGR